MSFPSEWFPSALNEIDFGAMAILLIDLQTTIFIASCQSVNFRN